MSLARIGPAGLPAQIVEPKPAVTDTPPRFGPVTDAERQAAIYLPVKDVARLLRSAIRKHFPQTQSWVRCGSSSSIDVYVVPKPGHEHETDPKALQALVKGYEGGGFDGMIDLGYAIGSWMHDRELTQAHSDGTVGSRGSVSPFSNDRPHPHARYVRNGARFVNVHFGRPRR